MRKGEGGESTTILTLLLAWELWLFIAALIIFMWVLPLLFTNPCWSDVKMGFDPLVRNQPKKPQMILDPDCVDTVVFATSSETCEIACNFYNDPGEIVSCAKKCKADVPDPKSYIVLIPRTYDFLQRGRMAIGNGLLWMFNGKPEVFIIESQIQDLQIQDERCTEFRDGWKCEIPDECTKDKNQKKKEICKEKTYYLDIESYGDGCKICASETRDGGCALATS